MRVLRSIAWPPEVATGFFEGGARELPVVEYPRFDPQPVLDDVETAVRLIDGSSPVHSWLQRVAASIAKGSRMLAAIGTPEFHRLSCQLYGAPSHKLTDGIRCPLDLARHLDQTLDHFSDHDLYPNMPARLDAEAVAATLRRVVQRFFPGKAPEVEVVDHLSANALAGAGRIRLRRGATFSDRDVRQLVHHEAFVHVCTTLNGLEQNAFPILAGGHPGTTKTQEGLAVFAELISGSMDPDRLRRLADRTIAIQMAIEGADFLQIYHYFLARTDDPSQSFENARRVFRGGVLTGGAPFTKDGVYIEGLLRVHNFLRSVVQLGRMDCLHLLFCGKLDLGDVTAVAILATEGMCDVPRFLPPWASDLRFLTAYLAYSSFLAQVDMHTVRTHYARVLSDAPLAPAFANPRLPPGV